MTVQELMVQLGQMPADAEVIALSNAPEDVYRDRDGKVVIW